jgi:hypothetical protein
MVSCQRVFWLKSLAPADFANKRDRKTHGASAIRFGSRNAASQLIESAVS